ncbi:MAG TPA: methyltransferase [Chitinophagaceae bacterium]|nr:methyltransferase [Chitinophagaceae bacterium]
MSNTYFQFKQFKIEQEYCAMKVCTDACLQGALAAREVLDNKPKTILDIGTGTGLLSLMLAQNNAFKKHDAIEINKDAFKQAKENFTDNVLGKNIRLILGDIRFYAPDYQYDFIICNPPFYENALKSLSVAKKQAMHASHLDYDDLLSRLKLLLKPEGICSLMLPFDFEKDMVYRSGNTNIYPYKIVRVKNKKEKSPFRSLLFLRKGKHKVDYDEIVIRNSDNSYTEEFQYFLRPYYLNL